MKISSKLSKIEYTRVSLKNIVLKNLGPRSRIYIAVGRAAAAAEGGQRRAGGAGAARCRRGGDLCHPARVREAGRGREVPPRFYSVFIMFL